MSYFSFSLSVFERPVFQTCKNQGLFEKGLMTDIYTYPKQKVEFVTERVKTFLEREK